MAFVLKAKIVHHGQESRDAILRGVDLLANAVKVTLGPKGRNVVIGRRAFGHDPMVTKDGVTVASHVNPTDPCEQIGADLLRSAAQKTVDNAGDGTTTAVVLAQAMLHAGFKALEAGASPIAIKRGMDRACEAITAAIRQMAIPATGDMLLSVARISSNGDESLAQIVSDALAQVGKDGVITVEESRTLNTHLEVVTGLQLNSGFLSPYFITNPHTMKCEYDNPLICLWEGKLSSAKALVPLLNVQDMHERPLLIIAGEYDNEAISVLAINRIRKHRQICAVTTGAFGDRRRELLRDVAAITGATAFTEDLGAKIENVMVTDLGTARKIIVDEKRTLVIGSQSAAERISDVHKQLLSAEGVEKLHLQARLSGLTGGVAIIKVGAVTEVEMKEKKDRAEDAMYAVKAAAEEGVVEGGGMALIRAGLYIAERTDFDFSGPGERIVLRPGERIVLHAIGSPLKQIAENAGETGVMDKVRTQGCGYDAAADVYHDLIAAGILDPAKVVIEALKNAVSVAGMILTTEAMVAEVIEDDGR